MVMKARQPLWIVPISSLILLAAACLPATDETGGQRAEQGRIERRPAEKKYQFTEDVFAPNIPRFTGILADYRGRADIQYLEIGVFEGRSFFWMIDNIITHPTSRAVAIDLFGKHYEGLFYDNLEISGAAERVTVMKGYGEREAKKLPDDSFDIIYIDDGHTARNVFGQAAIAWELLKEGGVLIFDDYSLDKGQWPIEQRPEMAIDTFLTAYSPELEVIHKGLRNVFVRKVNACKIYASSRFFDKYFYSWWTQKLYTRSDLQEVEINEDEQLLIEKYLLSLKYGEVKPKLTDDMIHDPVFEQLQKRLNLTGVPSRSQDRLAPEG